MDVPARKAYVAPTPMRRFILCQNIRHLRELIAAAPAGPAMETLQSLLAETQAELRALESASYSAAAAHDAELRPLAERAIGGAMCLLGAQFGTMQLYNPATGMLAIIGQWNFRTPFLEHFALVRADDGSCCGRYLASGERVVIEDVAYEPTFRDHLEVARGAGFQAVQSTPLCDGSGRLLGILSTHFSMPRTFSIDDHASADRHAGFASGALARHLETTSVATAQAAAATT